MKSRYENQRGLAIRYRPSRGDGVVATLSVLAGVLMTACVRTAETHRPPEPIAPAQQPNGKPIRFTLVDPVTKQPRRGTGVAWFLDARSGVTAADANRKSGTTRSDADGHVAFSLPSTEGHLSVWAFVGDGTPRSIFATTGPDEGLDDINHQEEFLAAPLSAQLIVRSVDGTPIPGATATLVLGTDAGPDPFVSPMTSGADGKTAFRRLFYENYWCDVSAPGFATVRAPISLAGLGAVQSDAVVSLEPSRDVTISVSSAGRPLERFNLWWDYTQMNTANSWWRTISGSQTTLTVPRDRPFSFRIDTQGFVTYSSTVSDLVLDTIHVSLDALK